MSSDSIRLTEVGSASRIAALRACESLFLNGVFDAVCVGPSEYDRRYYISLRDHIAELEIIAPDSYLIQSLKRDLSRIRIEEKWRDEALNVVATEGRTAILQAALKGSSFTSVNYLGLIESTGYSSTAAGNLAANITAAGGGSPTNGWNEAPSSVVASRGTPSFSNAAAGSITLSTPVSFSVLGLRTFKGFFVVMKSAAGVSPSATVGSTSGALGSIALFTGGDKTADNGDTLNVGYTLNA